MSRLCIFIPSFGAGGVERMLVNTARGLAGLGVDVDFVVRRADAPYLDLLPASVRLLPFAAEHRRALLAALCDYLDRERPSVVLSAKGDDDRLALRAKRRVRGPTRFFLRPGTNVAARLERRGVGAVRRWLLLRARRALYAHADGIIAVSRGVADDVAATAGVARDRIVVIRNPNVTPDLAAAARRPVDHPWFGDGGPPVVLGIGGLRDAKDFPTLLRAFATARAARPCRLVILGEGRRRDALEALARRLGVAADVALPGFVADPYPYLARARLFVLSSLWEGSPNVLVEALALGTPVVATDCASGPREILRDGRYGPLVPVGDHAALARAMLATLDAPPDPAFLATAAADYTMEESARAYLRALQLTPAR